MPPQVDLETILINDSGDLRANMNRSLNLFVGLRFSDEVASNVVLTWTASMPLRLEEAQRYDTASQCVIVATTETTGTFDCGQVLDGEPGLVITMLFTPLQPGLLDFSVEFSADEEEIEPANNIQVLRGLVIVPDPNNPPRTLTKLSGDSQEGLPREDLPQPLTVSVLDRNGSAFAGAIVTFQVASGDGTLSVETAVTDTGGLAASTLTLGVQPGENTVTVSVAGLDPVTFTATAKVTTDFDGDGETGFSDFFLFADAFGTSDPRFDLDGSGSVDLGDFFLLADHFGRSCPRQAARPCPGDDRTARRTPAAAERP